MHKIILLIIFLISFSPLKAEVINNLEVTGNKRVSEETVKIYGDIILKDKQLINEILDKKYLLNENFFNYKYEQFLKGDNYFSNYIWNELILNIAIQNN